MTNDDAMRDNLMPVRKTEMLRFKKVHEVQVKNDMKAGETLQFTCIIDVPTYVIDGPGGGGKIPVGPNYILSQAKGKYVLRNYKGKIYTYLE